MADETPPKTSSSFLPIPSNTTEEERAAALASPNADAHPEEDSLDEDEESYHSRIVIKPNGEVVIENLSMDLMELLEKLNPDAEIACQIPHTTDDTTPTEPS